MRNYLKSFYLCTALPLVALAEDQNAILSMDDSLLWTSNFPTSISGDTRSSDNGGSLKFEFDNYTLVQSIPFEMNKPPSFLNFDLYHPQENANWQVTIKAFFSCPQKHLYNKEIGAFTINKSPKNTFNSYSFKFDDALINAFGDKCSNASVSFGLNKSNEIPYILLDRIAVNYIPAELEQPLCRLERLPFDESTMGEDGLLASQRWVTPENIANEVRRLDSIIQQQSEIDIIEYMYDDVRKSYRVIVDKDQFNDGIVAKTAEMLSSKGLGIQTIVQPSCYSLATYESIIETIEDPEVFVDAPLTRRFDEKSGQIVVLVAEDKLSETENALRKYGNAIRVEIGGLITEGRLEDGEPHYGGARINIGGNICTADFLAKKTIDGIDELGAITNAHCTNGLVKVAGNDVFSGSFFYGTTGERAPLGWDAVFIRPGGEVFDGNATFHTSPPANDTRQVLTTRIPYKGQPICISGSVSGAKCSIEVNIPGRFDQRYFNPEGESVLNPYFGDPIDPSRSISAKGDSGAPIYQPVFGEDTAWAVGIHIGSLGGSSNSIIFQSASAIEQELGVTIDSIQ